MSKPITFTKERTAIVRGLPVYRFLYNNPGGWQDNFIETDRQYDYGENQRGEPYYIKYTDSSFGDKYFDIYPIEDDLYEDKDGNMHPVEWGKYNDGSTILPNLNVYPKTGKLILYTDYPIVSQDYPWTGHSELSLIPDYLNGPKGNVSMNMNDLGYNLVTNNCADATRMVMEEVFGKLMNPWFFTTPGDSKDFLLENGGRYDDYGNVFINLTEEQMIKASNFIKELRKQWSNINKYKTDE